LAISYQEYINSLDDKMAKTVVAIKKKPIVVKVPSEALVKDKHLYDRNAVKDIYLKTTTGVVMLMGRDGDEVRSKIEQDKEHLLDYRFFDDDRRAWAYWAVSDGNRTFKPPEFPDTRQYSLTSMQLFTKSVTYPHILAHAAGLLKGKPQTLWDRMLKPTTIITAIVIIIFIMGLMLVALTG
jgi:hypothetical protein